MVPFAGFQLPVQYGTGIIAEHNAVRTNAGLFDVSHMGEIVFSGPGAEAYLDHLLTNRISGMEVGQARYSPMCNEQGGIVDDLIVYKTEDERFLVVVNAANRDKDIAWMRSSLIGNVQMQDISDDIVQLALQGPRAADILSALTDAEAIPKRRYTFAQNLEVAGISCLISRTGYTGSDGFELYTCADNGAALWSALLGADGELFPCGLGARDTLRLEAGMPLYGHEMDEGVTPFEAGLAFAVKMDKADFIGKEALLVRQPKAMRVGLAVTGRGIIREGAILYADDRQVGVATSGTHCPYIGYAAAMALLDPAYSSVGTQLDADVRGKRVTAEVVKLPFYTADRKV